MKFEEVFKVFSIKSSLHCYWYWERHSHKLCDITIHPNPKFNGGLTKPPLKLWHGWEITCTKNCKRVITYLCPNLSVKTRRFWRWQMYGVNQCQPEQGPITSFPFPMAWQKAHIYRPCIFYMAIFAEATPMLSWAFVISPHNRFREMSANLTYGAPWWRFGVLDTCTKWLIRTKQLWIHCDRDKMANISQTAISNGFSWMKLYEFRLIFTEVCS